VVVSPRLLSNVLKSAVAKEGTKKVRSFNHLVSLLCSTPGPHAKFALQMALLFNRRPSVTLKAWVNSSVVRTVTVREGGVVAVMIATATETETTTAKTSRTRRLGLSVAGTATMRQVYASRMSAGILHRGIVGERTGLDGMVLVIGDGMRLRRGRQGEVVRRMMTVRLALMRVNGKKSR
jgi:hypothetical protein